MIDVETMGLLVAGFGKGCLHKVEPEVHRGKKQEGTNFSLRSLDT